MKKTYCIPILLLSMFFLYNCTKKKTHDNKKLELLSVNKMKRLNNCFLGIDVETAKSISTDDFLLMIKSIDYIQLDTKELIGEVTKMIITDNQIFVLDAFITQRLFVFDRKGKLLFLIQEKGQGPEEYVSIWDFQVDTLKKVIIINDPLSRNNIYYSSINGKFIKKTNSIANCYFSCINDKFINQLADNQDFNKDEDYSLIITVGDSIVMKGFALYPIQKNNYIVNSLYKDSDGKLLFTPLNSDTIYQLNEDFSFFPKYIVEQGKSIWEKRDENLKEDEISLLIKEKNFSRFSGKFLASKSHAVLSVQHKFKEYISSVPYIWDKKHNVVFKWNINRPSLINDIIVAPVAVYNNTYFGYFSGQGLLENAGNSLNHKLKELLKISEKEANPILVQYEFK